ncbi:MAG: hypothetical protein DRP63_05280 [Planctomycetota bacterium]|nr:MAG: hypothetical protein DRP63_05280 [Planctomycetota bacterium]
MRFLGFVAVAALVGVWVQDVRSQQRNDVTVRTRKAVKAALDFLAKQQNADGSFGANYQLAASSLAGLAFLGYGSNYNYGPYRVQIQKLVEYILKIQDAEGYFDDGQCRMHGHGYATLFLAMAYGSMPPGKRKQVKKALQKAVRITVRSQSRDGGWYYWPAHSGRGLSDEGSVTVTQVQALRACRDAGIYVPKSVIDRGQRYIKRSTTRSGTRYRIHGGRTTVTLTAAGVAVMNAYGVYDPRTCIQLKWGLDVIKRAMKSCVSRGGAAMDAVRWTWYGNLYLSQASWQAGDEMWRLYYPTTYKRLLSTQGADGSWTRARGGRSYGAVFSTAIAALIFEVPMGYLPLFQRAQEPR